MKEFKTYKSRLCQQLLLPSAGRPATTAAAAPVCVCVFIQGFAKLQSICHHPNPQDAIARSLQWHTC